MPTKKEEKGTGMQRDAEVEDEQEEQLGEQHLERHLWVDLADVVATIISF